MPGGSEWLIILIILCAIVFFVFNSISKKKSTNTNEEILTLVKTLDELRKNGSISDIEYTKRKTELLNRIK